ncbi:MAG: type 4a pilus biogenesis protein PilO [Rubrivivax sp.]
MATSSTFTPTTSRGVDVSGYFDNAASQFRNLNTREPGQWPVLPKAAVFLAAAAVVVGLGWLLMLSDSADTLEAARQREPGLKSDYRSRLSQAVNLSELRKQKLQVQEFVTQLEKQLPGKAEMDALLSDINQAGLGRGLQFELFRPGQVQVKDYYAELPIAIRVSGKYHDIGAFAADVANLSRIVTLQNLSIAPGVGPAGQASREPLPGGTLAMDATARTYRYLDATEVAEQRKAAAAAKAPGAVK